jgi:hypothetical protein
MFQIMFLRYKFLFGMDMCLPKILNMQYLNNPMKHFPRVFLYTLQYNQLQNNFHSKFLLYMFEFQMSMLQLEMKMHRQYLNIQKIELPKEYSHNP